MDEKLVAVIVGAFCGMMGYFFTTFWMKPIIQYRDVKTKILIDLIFYAQVVNVDGLNEKMQKLHTERNDHATFFRTEKLESFLAC